MTSPAMSLINTCIQTPERPARGKRSKIKGTYSQWARWAMSRSRPNSPIRPPTTYVWEDLRRSRSRGGYPWTHLDKEQLPNSINPEVILQGDDHLYRSLSSSPVPFDYPIHHHNRSNSLSSGYVQELQALSYTSSIPGQPNGSLTASIISSDHENMADPSLHSFIHSLRTEEPLEDTGGAEAPQTSVNLPTMPSTESEPPEQSMTVQEQVQAFIDDLPSEEELPEYLVTYLSQRTDDDSLPEHILEYLQQRVAKLQEHEQMLRDQVEKQNGRPPAKEESLRDELPDFVQAYLTNREEDDSLPEHILEYIREQAESRQEHPKTSEASAGDELPDFLKAYLSNRQEDDSLPEHILEYLREEAEKIQHMDEEEMKLVDTTFKQLDSNRLGSYDEHYVRQEKAEETQGDQFDEFFNANENEMTSAENGVEGDEHRENVEQAPEKKRKVDNLKEAMKNISEPAKEKFNSLKRNVKKVNAEAMKKLKPAASKRSESASPIRKRIGESFSRVQERMSSLTRGKKRSKSRMEKDIEDGYEPIAHPSAVSFQITTYESEDQVPRVYGLQSTSADQQEDKLPPPAEEELVEIAENLDNPDAQKPTTTKNKVSDMFSKSKDVWKNTTTKSKEALKNTAVKSKDAITVTANKSKTAFTKSKVALQSTAAKSKEALKVTGEKLQTSMNIGRPKKPEEQKGQLEPQDSLEGTSSAIFDVEIPAEEQPPEYDTPRARDPLEGYDVPSFSCDVAYSTPKSNQLIRNMVLEHSYGSEDFNNYFPQSETTVEEDQPKLAVDNPDYYNVDFSQGELARRYSEEGHHEDFPLQSSPVEETNIDAIEPLYVNGTGNENKEPELNLEERKPIEKPIRRTKQPKQPNLNATTFNNETEYAMQEVFEVESHKSTECSEYQAGRPEEDPSPITQVQDSVPEDQNAKEEGQGIVAEQQSTEEIQTLSRPSRKPKKSVATVNDENKENTQDWQRSLRPSRTKKPRTASKDASSKDPENSLTNESQTLPHYAVPRPFSVDIEAFNAQLEAAFQGSTQEYDVPVPNPDRPSRSRAKKKTLSSALPEPQYHNVPLRKKKSFSRDLPNILNGEIQEAPTTLPRKKKPVPSKPNRSRSRKVQSESIVDSITTIPRRKKKAMPILQVQEENIKNEHDDEIIKTFPRRKQKRSSIAPALKDTDLVVSEQPFGLSEAEPPHVIALSELNSALSDTEPPHVIALSLVRAEQPQTLPRKKKSSRTTSSTREQDQVEAEVSVDEGVTTDIVAAEKVSDVTVETEEVEDEPAIKAEEYITSADSLEADISDMAERIQWVEITSPGQGLDDGYGYAVITKVGEKRKKPPRPPPPVPDDANEQYEYPVSPPPRPPLPDSYCTAPRRKKTTSPKLDRSYCTIRPQRPTRRHSHKEQRQSTPHPGESDHMEELQSAEVVERMNKRPLPPLPRTKKKQGKSSDSGSDRDSATDLPDAADPLTEADASPRPKLGQLPTIVSTEGSQEDPEIVQTGRLSFALSESAAPVAEMNGRESPSKLRRCVEMENLRVHDDTPIDVPESKDSMETLSKPEAVGCALYGPPRDVPRLTTELAAEVPISPFTPERVSPLPEPHIRDRFEVTTNQDEGKSLPASESTTSIIIPIEENSCPTPLAEPETRSSRSLQFCPDELISNVVREQPQDTAAPTTTSNQAVICEMSHMEPQTPRIVENLRVDTQQPPTVPQPTTHPSFVPVNTDQLNELMNEVEKNLEKDMEKDIEDKIIILSASSTQNLTYTPIEEVSISVQTEPSREFEPLADIVTAPRRPASTEILEAKPTNTMVVAAPSTSPQPIIQPVMLNPEIRFPEFIPVHIPPIPPLQVDLPQRLRLTELEVDRLTVNTLTVRTISAEDLATGILQVTEIQSHTPLNVSVSVDPSTINIQVPELPPQQVVHIYERSESPVPTRPSRRKSQPYQQPESKDEETIPTEDQALTLSEPPASFTQLRDPDAQMRSPEAELRTSEARLRSSEAELRISEVHLRRSEAQHAEEPTISELATQLAAASARQLGSMAASAVGAVSSTTQLVLRSALDGMWTQLNAYLERHGVLLDSKQQESSKVLLICLILLVLFVIFLGMRGSRGPRWEYYMPPN